jgi:quercetin dioxygenase-like cupin family protein
MTSVPGTGQVARTSLPRRGPADGGGATRHTLHMSNLRDISDFPLLEIWGGDAVRARRVQGERITFAVVELAPNAVVPEHRHPNEQLGMVITGQMLFTIDGETRTLGPGGTWRILGDRPHAVTAGPEGAVVIDVFNPVREDWDDKVVVDPPAPTRWPPA